MRACCVVVGMQRCCCDVDGNQEVLAEGLYSQQPAAAGLAVFLCITCVMHARCSWHRGWLVLG
jgi:hypothetical protein